MRHDCKYIDKVHACGIHMYRQTNNYRLCDKSDDQQCYTNVKNSHWSGYCYFWLGFCLQSYSRLDQVPQKGTSEHNQHRVFTGWECWMLFLTPKQQCQTTDFNNAKIINWMRSFSFSLHRLIPMEGDATPFMGN